MIDRYSLPDMKLLWSDEAKFQSWLEVEVQAAKAMARYNIIPAKAAKVIAERARFDVRRINEIEAEVNHDVVAFLTSMSENIGEEAKWLHYGMTSSDMLDTAQALRIRRASEIIDKKLNTGLRLIRSLARKHKMTPCLGRTHGVAAEPMTLGLKFAVWFAELSRRQEAFRRAAEQMKVGAISGAVGNYANLEPRIEAAVLRALRLRPAPVSTQVIQRDRHAEFISSLALIGSSLEKFATEIRNLQRTEIGELQEGFGKKQKGSSAMPHKKNPITAERVTGIARLLRGYTVSAMENVALWHERDIAHSSVERVILPDATTVLDYGLQKFNEILKGLVVNKKRMLENIWYGGGLVFSQRLLLKLAGPVGSRDVAYRMVQKHAMAAHERKGEFKDLVKGDPEITAHLTEEEIDTCFGLDYYTRHVDAIFERVFTK
ncbi:adenylosuccinate lyase [candidate division GN15 bacterium]|nr:adenylosuccinate lyase [candidate division GN15 bacterium]